VVTGAVVVVVMEVPVVDVDDVDGGEVELVQAASVMVRMRVPTTITPSLRTVIILSPITISGGLGHWRSAIPVDVDHPKRMITA
jgi:hypothetical protein